ncbi:hypothetical protein BG011_003441, partial [Mortierella polycephala]
NTTSRCTAIGCRLRKLKAPGSMARSFLCGATATWKRNMRLMTRIGQRPVRCKYASSRRMVQNSTSPLFDASPDMTLTSIPIPRTRNQHNLITLMNKH